MEHRAFKPNNNNNNKRATKEEKLTLYYLVCVVSVIKLIAINITITTIAS